MRSAHSASRRLVATTAIATVLSAWLFWMAVTPAMAQPARPDDVAPYVPAGATVAETTSSDTDGDGVADTVVRYSIPESYGTGAQVGVLVLRGPVAARTSHHLFGSPPDTLDAPTLDPGDPAELIVRDLDGDGPAEVAVRTERGQRRLQEQGLWVFRWDGTTYRLEAMLEGERVQILSRDAAGAGLRVRTEERPWGSDSPPSVTTEETYRWRSGGYRLTERSITPDQAASSEERPESVVLGYYRAIDRGDLRAAYSVLGTELRAAEPFERFAAGFVRTRGVRVEEVRPHRGHWNWRDEPFVGDKVYVRLTAVDEGAAGLTEASYAGTWRVRRDGGRWRLEAARIGPAPSLAAIADALPGGYRVLQTAQGDLRGTGADDLAMIAQPPGRYPDAEPYVLRRSGERLRATKVGDLIGEESIGSFGGDVTIDDVNGDGRPELVYSSVVGAHSSVLWIIRWDGQEARPIFRGFSNSAGLGLQDLDDDGLDEILTVQSGYCGSYAGSPSLAFASRWRDGAYRPATVDYPKLQAGFANDAREALVADPPDSAARACIHHMLATSHAFAGRARDGREAYGRYQVARPPRGDEAALGTFPSYVGSPSFEEDVREVLARAESGRLGTWGPTELAFLHDLLGNILEARAAGRRFEAEYEAREGKPDQAAATLREADRAQAEALREYRAAAALDPTDREARDALEQLAH